jgi:hypothetical protein
MAFIVSAAPEERGDGSVRLEKSTRKAAVESAVELLGQGLKLVTITDEGGRVFTSPEFASFLTEEK